MVTQTHRKLGALSFAVAALVGVSLFCAGDASAITINSDTTLDDNVTDGIVVEEGSTVTLNLNGKTVTNTNSKQASIINRGTLTIIGEGTVSTDQSGTAAVTNYPDAHLTISGGTYSSELWYIIRNYGDMTINAGVTVIGAAANANNASLVTNGWYGSVDVNNGENILANSGSFEPTLVINGGTFTAGTTNCSVIKNDDYSHLVINDGEFSQPQGSLPDCDTVILNWNHAEIYGGTYHSENGRIISTRDEDILYWKKSTWVNKDYIKKTSDWGDDEQLNFYLNYSNTFNDVHRLDAVLLTEWYEGYNSQVYGARETFPVYLYDQFWAASDARQDTYGGGDASKRNELCSFPAMGILPRRICGLGIVRRKFLQ